MKQILFVCTGNTCRSPMAAALFEKLAADFGLSVAVKSAGISAMNGAPAATHALAVLREREIEFTHQSLAMDVDLIDWADVILTMTDYHRQILIHEYPEAIDKTFVLKAFARSDEQMDALYKELDQLHLQMQEKRVEIKRKYVDHKNESWNQAAEAAWEQAIQPLISQERDLRNRLNQYTLNQDVNDPFGGTMEEYRHCLQELESSIRQMMKKWK